MERNNQKIVLLLDNYSADSQKLYRSFVQTGLDIPTFVAEDNGFLPEGMHSIYDYFLGDFSAVENGYNRSRYFNEITVPDFWEIKGTAAKASVYDQSHERAKIFYAQQDHKRRVKTVDWFDDKGVVRVSDHYNKYGALYAKTVFNAKGQKVNKTYFHADGKIIIEENFVTNDIQLMDEGIDYIFHSKTELICHLLKKAKLTQHRLFFNSLAYPFFVSNMLPVLEKGEDVLFWQEPVREDIPGNMQMILNHTATRAGKIMVQKRASYEKLISLGVNADIVKCLGYVYPFKKESNHQPQALILTNSDQIGKLDELVLALPMVHFHIAAITEMSSKLLGKGDYENVSVYPTIKLDKVKELYQKCDIYLDINSGSELLSAISEAFLNNLLNYAFSETIHNKEYVLTDQVYSNTDYEKMITAIKNVLDNSKLWDEQLEKQRVFALSENKDCYLDI